METLRSWPNKVWKFYKEHFFLIIGVVMVCFMISLVVTTCIAGQPKYCSEDNSGCVKRASCVTIAGKDIISTQGLYSSDDRKMTLLFLKDGQTFEVYGFLSPLAVEGVYVVDGFDDKTPRAIGPLAKCPLKE